MRVDFFMGRGPGREWLGFLEGEVDELRAAIAPVLQQGSAENYREAVGRVGLSQEGDPGAESAVDYLMGRAYFHAEGPGEAKAGLVEGTPTTPTAAVEATPAEEVGEPDAPPKRKKKASKKKT